MDGMALGMHDPADRPREQGYIEIRAPGPPPGRVLAGHVTPCYRREILRPEGTRDWMLAFTLKGRAFFKQPAARVEVGAGDVLLAEPGAYMHYAPARDTGGWDCLWAHFNPRPGWLEALKLPRVGRGLYRLHVVSARDRKPLDLALRRCIEYSGAAYGGYAQELALAALEEVVFLIARETARAGGGKPLSPVVRRVVDVLNERMAEGHSLAALAREAHLSPSRLTHRFKAETGESVIGYLLKLRLRRAAQMLQEPGRSIKEVAFAVGFRSPFYFSRQFRSHFHASPLDYQRRTQAPGPAARRKKTAGRANLREVAD